MKMGDWNICTISDSTGETGEAIARAWLSQFTDLDAEINRHSQIDTKEEVDQIFKDLREDTIVLNSVVIPEIQSYIMDLCHDQDIAVIDLFDRPIKIIEEATGKKAVRKPGLTREMDPDYFNKIASIEFAVRYDDGKNPRGLLAADIVLLGVSRTSKTPLSMFLANKGYNVANLPLVPEVDLPKEIYQVDPKRIIGLIIQPEKLNQIRESRVRALGLSGMSIYADRDRIEKELSYAKDVFDKIGCEVLDVSGSTIEQTATCIIEIVRDNLGNSIRRYRNV